MNTALSTLSPLQQYQEDLLVPDFRADPSQLAAITQLDKIYHELIAQVAQRGSITRLFTKRKEVIGCYLWGSVGTGKSYLMNTFYHCLPFTQKTRLHFHEFMKRVNDQLREFQGHSDPLKMIAKMWAKEFYVICFDEFFVKDIADAMILGELLKQLFSEGVCLIATSNVEPGNLYKNGLQRERFLPAIAVLQQHVTVLNVDNQVDYRMKHSKPAAVFFTPLGKAADTKMLHCFHYYAENDIAAHDSVRINNRLIHTIRCHQQVIWLSFHELCETARSAQDYLVLAQKFKVVLLSDVPIIKEHQHDIIARFINLIDVLYDNHTQLIMSAAAPIDELYQGEKWGFEYKRTKSRLTEMQSEEYQQA